MEQEEPKPDPIKLAEKLRKEHSEKLAKKLAYLKNPTPESDSKKEISTEEPNTFTQKDFDRHEFDPETVAYSKGKYKDGVVHDEDVGKKKLEAKKAKKIPENSKESGFDKDAKDSAEKKAEKEKEAQEKSEKIEKIKQDLEVSRKEYAEMYFKKRKMWNRVKGFFGNNLTKEGRERAGRTKIEAGGIISTEDGEKVYDDKDTSYLQAIYENKLIDYRNALLENLQSKRLQGEELKKEMAEIMKIFNLDEAANLYDAKTEARAELAAKDNSALGKIKEKGSKVISWYIKLPTWKKLLLAGGLGIGAASASYAGAAAATSFMVMNIARRILAGSASAVGVEAISEKVAEKYREKKSGKEIDEYLKKVEKFDFKDFNKFLADKTFEVNENFEKRNIGSLFRKSGAILLGTVAASGAMDKVFHFASEKMGAGEWAKEHIFGKTIQQEVPGAGKTVPEAIADAEKPEAGQGIENNISEKTIEKAETVLEVQKGSSLEGSIIQHLKGHPELIEKYNELNGGRSFNAGQIAHRMALDYADKYPESFPQGPPSLIHEGTEIRMNLGTMEIEDIQSEEKIGYLPENNAGGTTKPELSVHPEINTEANVESVEKEFSDIDQGPRNRIVEDIANKEREINNLEEEPASKYSHNTNNPLQHSYDLDKLKGSQRELWEKIIQENTVAETARDIRKEIAISNPQNWKQVKDLTFDQIKDANVGDGVKDNVAKVYRFGYNVFGKESIPKNGETVAKWTERLARLIIKNK